MVGLYKTLLKHYSYASKNAIKIYERILIKVGFGWKQKWAELEAYKGLSLIYGRMLIYF
jgi:hypothetical protein